MLTIRLCTPADRPDIFGIINEAAQKYRGVIPADRWHDPYMPAADLDRKISAGVTFWGCVADGKLIGVMGTQKVDDVVLIRHAYVAPAHQGCGAGSALLRFHRRRSDGRILVGTWEAADWAIGFYERHGFTRCAPADIAPLLRRYWRIPDRQVETSVVLTSEAPGSATSP
jgi:GNAT superfamily N-acetyltransferase